MLNVFAFRLLLIASLVVPFLGLIIDLATAQFLPPLLQLHTEGWQLAGAESGEAYGESAEILYLKLQLQEGFTSPAEVVGAVLLLPFLAALIVGYVGLFRLRAWGAWLMLGLSAFVLLLYPLIGPIVQSSWAEMFFDLSGLLDGVVLAVIFLGPMRRPFFGDGPILPWLAGKGPQM